ncbi:MAG: hypothetical protein AAFQ90_07215 [Pseudomonadota bacterium]
MKTTEVRLLRPVAVFVSALLLTASLPLAAQSLGLEMLSGLSKGEWTVNYRDGSGRQKICLKTGMELIQLQHSQSNCNQIVIEETASEVTVQYTCKGAGYGRTNIRRENGALVQIESIGIASGLPFELAAEARRTGSC